MIKKYEIPDVRDGLTSLQRRVLWTMKTMERTNKKDYIRTYEIISEAGKGENLDGHHNLSAFTEYPIFGALEFIHDDVMVPLAQTWRYSVPLIDGRGNWGVIYEEYSSASPIFTSCKLTEFAVKTLFNGLNQQTVKYIFNRDLRKKEPSVLPARVPNALINGTNGSSHIPPHNLGEVIDAAIAMIEDPDLKPEQLLDYIKGPDFPTGGTIINGGELAEIYQNGVGEIRIRGTIKSETALNEIIINEIPYTMLGAFDDFVDDIICLKRNKIMSEIKDIFDQSVKREMDLRITLKRKADPEKVIKLLYEYTDLEDSFDYRALLTVDGKPCLMSLSDILSQWLEFYRETCTKQNRGAVPTNDELIASLRKIKAKFAVPRKTKIVGQ